MIQVHGKSLTEYFLTVRKNLNTGLYLSSLWAFTIIVYHVIWTGSYNSAPCESQQNTHTELQVTKLSLKLKTRQAW